MGVCRGRRGGNERIKENDPACNVEAPRASADPALTLSNVPSASLGFPRLPLCMLETSTY